MSRLAGKKAVIVGGSSGLGKDATRAFIAEGADVLIAARDEAKLSAAASELGAHAFQCDLTDWEAGQALRDEAMKVFDGAIDVAVNCAGYEDRFGVVEQEPERVEKMVAVQFTAGLYFLQHMAQAMPKGGSLVTMSSLTATLIAEGYAAYAGAKAGLNHACRIAASELGHLGIRVNIVSPTVVDTPMVAELLATPGVRASLEYETPLGALPETQDVSNALVWLASDESRFVNGQNIHLDGGGNMRRLPRPGEFERFA